MSLISRFALFFFLFSLFSPSSSSLYLSPTTLFPNYQKMANNFKIFVYTPPENPTLSFTSPTETLFHSLLLNSSFIALDPEEAHLFFVPLPFSNLSARSISRAVAELRALFPYWNRTLGADHFLISCSGLGRYSDRNVVELNKNSIVVSCFPARPGYFIPHKDITFPPVTVRLPPRAGTGVLKYLGYVRSGWVKDPTWVKRLASDADILVESEPSDSSTYEQRLAGSRFCLFEYGHGDVSALGETMRFGCVPVLIADRPIQDLPLTDVLTWQNLAVFVGSTSGVDELKSVLNRTMEEPYDEMRESCMTAGKHLEWNEQPQPHDVFHMVMYQLWVRRHTIRYVQREWVFETAG